MAYFSSYIPFYAWIAKPLFQLLKKENSWDWSENHQEAFNLCKQVLTNTPVQGYVMLSQTYCVYTDVWLQISQHPPASATDLNTWPSGNEIIQ